MARRRFFVDVVRGEHATLEGETAEHLRRVLRAEPGQLYELSDNESVYLAEIDGFRKGAVSFRIRETLLSEPAVVRLILLASLIKFDRFEWIVEKATELGVESIIPIVAARSEKGLAQAAAKRLERWRRVGLESSQQSRRVKLPVIIPCAAFDEALRSAGDRRYFLDESREAPGLLSLLPGVRDASAADVVCMLVGPEGGWTEDERREAAEAGWTSASLGPQILRTETAVIAALAVISSAWSLGKKQRDLP